MEGDERQDVQRREEGRGGEVVNIRDDLDSLVIEKDFS